MWMDCMLCCLPDRVLPDSMLCCLPDRVLLVVVVRLDVDGLYDVVYLTDGCMLCCLPDRVLLVVVET